MDIRGFTYTKGLAFALTLVGVTFFQNCSKVNFSSANPSLQTANIPDGIGGSGTGTGTGSGTGSGTGGDGTGMPPGSGNGDGTNPPGSDTGTTAGENPTEIVECDMGSSNMKVIMSGDLQSDPSNSSQTRICMSQNACLNLVNMYAEARGCTLSAGAPSTPKAVASCTAIFPGSKGTCQNAVVLSDAQVANILANMSK